MSFVPVVPSLREALQPFSTIVLTGGSSGIGKSFIELVRKLNPELLICNISRRAPAKFSSGIPELKLNHFPCDLARRDDLARVAVDVLATIERDAAPGQILLINNSGFGAFGPFSELELSRELEMIDLNVHAVVHLTGLLRPFLQKRGGAIINIASTVAFQPTPYAATYGATKAFVLHWTVALNEELRGTSVRALAVCPGTTKTEFFQSAGLGDGAIVESLSMTSDEVVAIALRALAGGRSQVVPGWKNQLYTFFGSKLPKPLAARVAGKVLTRLRTNPAKS